jgi:hypothetical protein
MSGAIQADIQEQVESRLALWSVISKEGIHGPTCQTGEPYIELIIRASTLPDLVTAICGAVYAFALRDWNCYWRIKPDLELDNPYGPRAYLRFKCTNQPELRQEQAA